MIPIKKIPKKIKIFGKLEMKIQLMLKINILLLNDSDKKDSKENKDFWEIGDEDS